MFDVHIGRILRHKKSPEQQGQQQRHGNHPGEIDFQPQVALQFGVKDHATLRR